MLRRRTTVLSLGTKKTFQNKSEEKCNLYLKMNHKLAFGLYPDPMGKLTLLLHTLELDLRDRATVNGEGNGNRELRGK